MNHPLLRSSRSSSTRPIDRSGAARLPLLFVVLLAVLFSLPSRLIAGPDVDSIDGSLRRRVSRALDELPILFRENRGQWEKPVLFRGSASGAQITFLRDRISFGVARLTRDGGAPRDAEPAPNVAEVEADFMVWNVRFEGARRDVEVMAEGEMPSKAHFFGSGNARGITSSDYSSLLYRELYKDIDLRYYGAAHSLKYDYILRPGAEMSDIRMACDGITGLGINDRGELEIGTEWGTVIERTPYAYQEIDGKREEVDVRYILLNDSTYGFRAGEYRRDLPLVIDPVTLAWSTYIGGSSSEFDGRGYEGYLRDIAVDSRGFVYGTGWYTMRFPVTPGTFRNLPAGGFADAVVFKLNADGSGLVWATYIGGEGNDDARSIDIAPSGGVFVSGYTWSWDFPTTLTAFDRTYHGYTDVFAFRMTDDGSTLVYSTYIGGDGYDYPGQAALGEGGVLYITGSTSSDDFPTTPGVIGPRVAGAEDIFVVNVTPDGQSIGFGTLIGGRHYDFGIDITINGSGESFVTGYTLSNDFPVTPGAYQDIMLGDSNAVVFKLGFDGSYLGYSTYLGGTRGDIGRRIILNAAGEAIIGGSTTSANFPVRAGGYDLSYNIRPTLEPAFDGFVTRLSFDGSTVLASTYLGGALGHDYVEGLALDPQENIYIVGSTLSQDFPVTSCAFDRSHNGGYDLFVTSLSRDFGTLRFSTFIGGYNNDYGGNTPFDNAQIAVLGDSCAVEVVVGGTSHSPNFPTTPGAFQPAKENTFKHEEEDQPIIFRMKPMVRVAFTYDTTVCGIISFRNSSEVCVWDDAAGPSGVRWEFGDGHVSEEQNPRHQYASPGTYNVKLVTGCPLDSIIREVVVPDPTGVPADAGDSGRVCIGGSVQLLARGGVKFSWAPDIGLNCTDCSNPFASPTETTKYYVTVTDINGCTGIDSVVVVVVDQPVAAVSPDSRICEGDTTVLSAGGGIRYSWSPSTGLSCTECQNTVARPTTTTIYRVIVMGDAGCRGTDTAFVTVTVDPAPIITISRDTTICPGGSAQLSASGGDRYEWTPIEGLDCSTCASPTATPSATTTYTVTVTGPTGCRDSAKVTVTIAPGEAVDAGLSQNLCAGDTIQLRAEGPAPFRWSPSIGLSCTDCPDPKAYPSVTTLYTVTSSGSCGSTDTVTVTVLPRPPISAGSDTIICFDGVATLRASGAADYAWSPAKGLDCPSCPETHARPDSTTTYVVRGTSVEGCVSYDTVTVAVNRVPSIVRAHIERGYHIASGDSMKIPIVLDDPLGAVPNGEITIRVRYNAGMLRARSVSLEGTLLEGWAVDNILNDIRKGEFLATFRSTPGVVLDTTGRLVDLSVFGFLGSIDTSALELEVSVEGLGCATIVSTPGSIRLDTICALNLRLIEMSDVDYTLDQNKPNPFNPTTTINFSVGLEGPTTLIIFDAGGRKVATLIDQQLGAGRYELTWDASPFPSGLYYYRLTSGEWSRTKSMMLMK